MWGTITKITINRYQWVGLPPSPNTAVVYGIGWIPHNIHNSKEPIRPIKVEVTSMGEARLDLGFGMRGSNIAGSLLLWYESQEKMMCK
jgi:hypothetical protein